MSGMLDRLRARHETELRVTRRVVRQEMADMAVLALHRAFGFGPDRCKRFMRGRTTPAGRSGTDGRTEDDESTMLDLPKVLRRMQLDGPGPCDGTAAI